jgi:hypothetical protein
MLAGLPDRLIQGLRSVLNGNAVAQLHGLLCVTVRSNYPLLRDLHWLRILKRIDFNLAALVSRCLHGLYSSSLPCRQLHRVADLESRRRPS